MQTITARRWRSLRDLPAGDYWMQPFVNVYTEFKRADGHTLWMHMDQWEGQDWKHSPGNLYGKPVKVHYDPAAATPIHLVADQVIAPIPFPKDSEYVKRFRIQSKLLSTFWGHPIYLGATVLLPKGYAQHPDVRYPVVYDQGHFSTDAPFGFERKDSKMRAFWLDEAKKPRVIVVTLQHPSPFYDDSYAVNSPNEGPFDDAIHQELLPGDRATLPHHRAAVGAHPHRRLHRRLDRGGAAAVPSALLRRHASRCARTRWISAITRWSTSTTTPTRTTSTRAG